MSVSKRAFAVRRKPLYQVLLSELCGLLRYGSLGDLSEVQQGAHHVAGEAVLVVVPRNGTSHGHAVNGVDVGLGRIEHATVGVSDDVGRHDAILVVAVEVGGGEGSLECGVDLVSGDFLVQDGGQLGDGAIRNLDTLGVALQLAVHGRNDLADSLGSAGGVRNGVDCGGTVVA